MTLSNEGAQPHHLVAVKLEKNEDWTEEDVVDFIKEKPEAQPEWALNYAGAFGEKGSPIAPGSSAPVVFFDPSTASDQQPKPMEGGSFEPGTYMLLCFVTDPESKAPHATLGMVKKVTVS